MGIIDDLRATIQDEIKTSQRALVNELAKEAARICNMAVDTKETRDRTGNQLDAFGWAVYVDGKRVKYGRPFAPDESQSIKIHKGWKKRGIAPGRGRDFLYRFYRNYKPNPKGIEVVIVNAAFYSQILEDGTYAQDPNSDVPVYGGQKKYKVMSQVGDEVYLLKNKYKNIQIRMVSPVGSFG